jgi:hypothetical protein
VVAGWWQFGFGWGITGDRHGVGQGADMPSVEIFSDESQGHQFDIEVRHHTNGFTYQLIVQGLPNIRPGDELFPTLDKARQHAREQAWSLINQMVKSHR